MEIEVNIENQRYKANLNNPVSIGIPLTANDNPNCYYAKPPEFSPIRGDGFIGSLAEGGTVNHYEITLAPHGNGTHTECSGHIYDNNQVISGTLDKYNFLAQVISIEPSKEAADSYISGEAIAQFSIKPEVNTLVIRTLPNTSEKLVKNYSGTNPTYISEEAMRKIVAMGIEHLIVDLPSVDPEVDGGQLKAHKTFWLGERQNYCTITELAYVPDKLDDGLYLLNLQVLRIELDASPSNPVLYSLESI